MEKAIPGCNECCSNLKGVDFECNKGDYLFSVFNGFGRFSCFWTLFVFKGLLSFLLLSNEKVTSSSPHVLHSLLCCDKYIPENIV